MDYHRQDCYGLLIAPLRFAGTTFKKNQIFGEFGFLFEILCLQLMKTR